MRDGSYERKTRDQWRVLVLVSAGKWECRAVVETRREVLALCAAGRARGEVVRATGPHRIPRERR